MRYGDSTCIDVYLLFIIYLFDCPSPLLSLVSSRFLPRIGEFFSPLWLAHLHVHPDFCTNMEAYVEPKQQFNPSFFFFSFLFFYKEHRIEPFGFVFVDH